MANTIAEDMMFLYQKQGFLIICINEPLKVGEVVPANLNVVNQFGKEGTSPSQPFAVVAIASKKEFLDQFSVEVVVPRGFNYFYKVMTD